MMMESRVNLGHKTFEAIDIKKADMDVCFSLIG